MATTTAGRVLLKFFTPHEFHDLVDSAVLDSKGISKLFASIAEKAPQQYSKIASDLTRLGFEIATRQGTSITLKDLVSPIDKTKLWNDFEDFKGKVESGNDSKALKDKKIFEKYNDMMSGIEKEILAKGLQENKSLAKIILAGSRGSPAQYRGTIATQGIVVDADGKPKMDIPIKSSFAEGLTLPEYLVTSFGVRQGETAKKLSVAEGGYGCLAGDCKVMMADYSEKAIVDIVVGDLVMGADASGNIFPVPVTAKFNSGVKPVWRYTFRSLNSTKKTKQLDCTEDHKILCRNSQNKERAYQVPAGQLKIGGKTAGEPSAVLPKNVQDYGKYNKYALFLGLMLGDGCWSASTGTKIAFSCGDPSLIHEIEDYFKDELHYILKKTASSNYTYSLNSTECFEKIKVGNKQYSGHPTVNWLKEQKLLGTDSYTKFIPEKCKSWSKKAVCELLAGLYATDGHFKYVFDGRHHFTITITLCAKHVIETMQWLLEKRLGIETSVIATGRSRYKDKVYGNTYRLAISNAEMVSKFITLIDVPGIKKNTIALFKEKLEEVHNIYAPCKLITKNFLGELPTYDLEVGHPDHLFLLAGGLIVSNSKQFARALMPLQVVEADCDTPNGIDFSVDDRETVGSYLAKGVGGYNRNNEVTGKVLTDLKHKGIKHITVRSPMTCQSNKKHHSGGLCQMCVGKREKGMAAMDSYVGLVAGTAVAEPLTESAMKQRHSGGAATSLGGQQGFKLINQLANIPKTFIGKAPLAQADGVITKLEPAAAGGHFISVNDHEHYIGLDQTPHFSLGDRVEEGQALSSGLVDPRDVVKHKGIGEGRRYYMAAMKKAFDDSKLPVNRRNFELIAKAAIDHVKITDPEGIGDYLPDQVVSYSAIEKDYHPRADAKHMRVDLAYGKYLEKPELHYTIGTKLTSAVIAHLKEHHIESVLVHDIHPNFEPVMVRLVDIPEHHDDWMHVLNSTNLAKRFVNMVNRGATSDLKGASPIPGLAYGVGFGEK
jgi:hypothetical protein